MDLSPADKSDPVFNPKVIEDSTLGSSSSSTTTAAIAMATEIAKPTTGRPSWATGDPFFDTMAGMEPSEDLSYQKNLVESTATMALANPDLTKDTSASSSETPSEYINPGLDHWNRTREQWTRGQWHVVRSANSTNPALSAIHPKNHDAIYDSLVYDRKRLSKPIPLPLVIKVLVSGWKRDGLWQESPAQPSSAPTSAPSSASSSAPSHGPHAYIPGFSSTNSQPLQRKQ
ncbi:unnamed protein product [Mortierella alpina]